MSRFLLPLWLGLAVTAATADPPVNEPCRRDATGRPSIGLALSGGGARGAAHAGVLEVLEQLAVPVDCIAGTSMGAIVGGLYASGLGAAEIEEALATVDWEEAFSDRIARKYRPFRRKRDDDLWLVRGRVGFREGRPRLPTGFVQGQKISTMLARLTLPAATVRDFDELRVPFRAVATDLSSGEEVVLGDGVLAEALHASMAVPAVFVPVERDGRLLVDGGVANNLPVSVVRGMGADVVIAVDISTPLYEREELDSIFTISDQLANFLTRRNTEQQIAQMEPQDILILPDLKDITSGQFDRVLEAVAAGAEAANQARDGLAALGIGEPAYAAWLASLRALPREPPVITEVRIDNESKLDDRLLVGRADVEPGQPLDVRDLERSIDRIYGLELFDQVGYRLRETEGGTELDLQVRERSWGPGYLQLATRMSGSFDGDDVFGLGASFLQTEVNRWNAEWRAAAAVGDEPGLSFDFYQPLGVTSPWFVEPSLAYTRYNLNLFDAQGGRVSETRITEGGLTLATGFDVGDWGELRAGWRRVIGESEIQLGDPTQPDGDYDDGELFLQASVDAVDNLYFPSAGVDGRLALRSSRSAYGADESFDQVSFQGRVVHSWGRFSLRLGGDYHSTFSGIAPAQSLFRAGGLFRLSGYELNELSGQHFAQITVIPSLRVADFAFLPLYIGASLELGNVWQNERDIGFDDTLTAGSLWIGADTWLGPAHLAYGVAEGGRNSFYIFLGPVR